MSSSDLLAATVKAATLSATSNILAQVIKSYTSKTSFHLDTAPIIQFVIFAFISTPPNFVWQHFLEDTFPGYTVKPVIVDAKKDDDTETKVKEIVPEKKLDLKNTAIKFTLDQTIGALVNTILFVGAMAALRGETDFAVIVDKVWTDSWPLMLAGYRLWPIVSLLSFTLIPVQSRMVFGNLVGVGWGIFLSLFANH